MRSIRKHYQHGLQRGKRTVCKPRNFTDSARKRLKGVRDIILMHNTVYLGDHYMKDGRKRNKNSLGKPRPIRTSSDVVYGICRGLPSDKK